jgi:hypothetical protein
MKVLQGLQIRQTFECLRGHKQMMGDKADAQVIQRFPHAWRDAHPDVPAQKEAKAEYAKLR